MNIPKLLKQAEKLVSCGKVNEAISLYQEILSEDFQNTTVHHLIADLYISRQDTQRASPHLVKVAADYMSQGDHATAVTLYHKIIKILPRNILAREKLLEIFSKNGSKGELFKVIAELCVLYEGEGNTQKVIECLEKLVLLEPTNKDHRLKLALFLNENGTNDKAIELLYQIAQEFLGEGGFEEALNTLEKIKAIDPKHKDISLWIAEVFEKQGKVQKALEVLMLTLAADSSQTHLWLYLAKLCIKVGKIDKADRVYEKLIKINKGYLMDALPFVEVLMANKKIERALCYIENLYQEIENEEPRRRCVELLEEVLKLDPQNLDAYRLLEAFYSSSHQYDQLALTFLSHADAYVAKCDYAKALDLAKQLVMLEPDNEDYHKKYQFIESLASGGNQASNLGGLDPTHERSNNKGYVNRPADFNFDEDISIVTKEDIENFILDIELLEKFGQKVDAIRRLEHVLKSHPEEIKFRQKLEMLYLDCKMQQKAAHECLEIARVLQQQGQKEEANKYLHEAQRLNPSLSSTGKATAVVDSPIVETSDTRDGREEYVALKGDLAEIGLLDVIQILENSQKNGKLLINSAGLAGTIFFNSGRIVNATYQDKMGEPAMFALLGVKGGSFEYKPSLTLFDVVIKNGNNIYLLLEGLRLLDESNRDQGEVESRSEEDPTQSGADRI